MEVTKEKINSKNDSSSVRDSDLKSETPDTAKTQEVPSILLSPEQIEEIQADEYSLMLFYATRVEPLSASEIKKQFPEPEKKKAQSVLDRFVKVGLVHLTTEGKYYSNFPENYINYSHYRYDCDLEARKDRKVFNLMKEFTSNKEYWKNKSYFSMDAFYTEKQTKELQEMFLKIKLKAKEFANENAKKKSILGLFFRRLKFYDMIFSLLVGIFAATVFEGRAQAGGNDPTSLNRIEHYQDLINRIQSFQIGGGNDPTALNAPVLRSNPGLPFFIEALKEDAVRTQIWGANPDLLIPMTQFIESGTNASLDSIVGNDPSCQTARIASGGGGHDPDVSSEESKSPECCLLAKDGEFIPVYSPLFCRAQSLLVNLAICEKGNGENCTVFEDELLKTRPQSR